MTATAGTRTVCDYSPTPKEPKCTKWNRKFKSGTSTEYVWCVKVPQREQMHELYFSPNVMPVIKSRRIMRAGHAARMGGERDMMCIQGFGVET
jgi:hypothetical protein